LLYAQSYRDPATGLLYLINRYYDPATAQFLSVDPLVSDTAQPYEYAADNPLDQNDPNGLFCVLGHNPNGSCRGSNVGNDAHAVVIGLGVVALAATVAAAAIPAGATAAVLTGVAAVASGVAAAYGVEQVIDTCVSRGFGSSSCSSASLSNDFQTLLSFVPGKAGEILEVLSLLHLSGQADSSGSGGTASRPSSSGPQVGGSC
jgi:RHS repeat-associated protein